MAHHPKAKHMNTDHELDEEEDDSDWSFEKERLKSEATPGFIITEEICGTAVVLTVLIIATVLLLHWT